MADSMAEDTADAHSATDVGSSLQGPLNSHPPDVDTVSDSSSGPLHRHDTASSSADNSDKLDTCRICRSEGTPEEPLFYPCKCSGSIKFVHQECLMEWLSHSHKKHCELCKTPFRFTKLYDANMPQKLPWAVFGKRACVHVALTVARGCRALIVSMVWLVILPWLVRWAWRWMFWVSDAGWARESFMAKMQRASLESSITQIDHSTYSIQGLNGAMTHLINMNVTSKNATGPKLYQMAKELVSSSMGFYNELTNTTSNSTTALLLHEGSLPQADTSILSSWTYISELTPNARINRIVLDVCEGQLITCVVIVGFILVFLIREWVVQQQPLVNLDNLAHVQAHLREAAERVQADNERLRRQQELLEQARRRLLELQNETNDIREPADDDELDHDDDDAEPWLGLEDLDSLMDHATAHLRGAGEEESQRFDACAHAVTRQVRAAGRAKHDMAELTEKVTAKLAVYSPDERRQWESVLKAEVERTARSSADPGPRRTSELESTPENEKGDGGLGRPPMPDLDFSSRATQIQRLLEEAEEIFQPQEQAGSGTDSTVVQREAVVRFDLEPTIIPRPMSGSSEIEPDAASFGHEELPITNAGPDAKINIKRSGNGKTRAVPAPKEATPIEKRRRQDEDDAMKKLEEEINAEESPINAAAGTPLTLQGLARVSADGDISLSQAPVDANIAQPPAATPTLLLGLNPQHLDTDQATNNPFRSDGPPAPERRQSETLGSRVASAFREDFGLDEAEELLRQAGVGSNGETAPNDGRVEIQPPQRAGAAGPPGHIQRLTNWFWGDIQGNNVNEIVPASNEEREEAEQEAPFVPVQQGALQPPPAPVLDHALHHHDPEVVAAAAEVGLDADAIEDAEDLEGIFELIGLQGPLIGLFQTSTFCTILVTGTVYGAVGLPYVWGKLVLNFIGSPAYFLIQMPLQIASVVADFCVDLTLLVGGWLVFVLALAADFLLAGLQAWLPTWLDRLSTLPESVSGFAMATAAASGSRLQSLFMTQEPLHEEILGWNWAVLGASVHAHASLKDVEGEVGAILGYAGSAITAIADTVSTGSLADVCRRWFVACGQLRTLPAKLLTGVEFLKHYTQPLLKSFGLLRTGSLTFETPIAQAIDPSLVYWDSTDRSLAVLAGYLSLAALAAIYVAIDQPITRSEQGRKTEKLVRDTLRQAGGVLKVILIISIEMLVFPLYCGLLLDLAFLPLFQDASVATRWAFAKDKATLFCFLHWFIGTCYMFHFALFVGMCRMILRKGVLWFIRDPDDPTFHPVRDVLERNVTTQLRKIAFSALVYGALVILCLGGVIWGIGQVFHGIFPIRWVSTEPVVEFPMDLLLYNAITPLLIRLVKPSNAVNAMYAWWLRRCARVLRLSHFLFDDRRMDEEGRYERKSWASLLLMRTAASEDEPSSAVPEDRRLTETAGKEEEREVTFHRDGKYVLTPCNDQYRPPKAGEAFLHYDDDDVYIADKDGKKNDHFAKVYVPPYFRFRITLFMVCLWMFSAFTGLCATLVPLCFGRQIFASLLPTGMEKVNDIYAYTVGAYILGGALFTVLQCGPMLQYLRQRSTAVDIGAWTTPAKRYALQALKCVYFYGFLGLVLPTVFALLLQFYFILPLHTYIVSMAASIVGEQNAAVSAIANMTASASTAGSLLGDSVTSNDTQPTPLPTLAQHTIHILQDYCLGLLYIRLATRFILTTPASRAAEAFRRITADGYLNPNVRLATRFLIAPISLLITLMLLVPPVLARLAIVVIDYGRNPQDVGTTDAQQAEWQTKMYRYAYPVAAVLVMLMLCGSEVGRATSRWRARIRDEVYLVGERLHNFGEKRPPAHSKSVVRKER
ncbi:hypothetical protein LTR08_002363 [Meristemomyces frigidus]|nr:hypothetical protein LTR08_002363 [Meristemomyces frigidus]